MEEIDRAGLHAVDAHASAKVMARHVCGLSGAEAEQRGRAAKALRHLPEVRSAFRAGRIGGCQVDRIARVHANPRVRDALEANEGSFADEARDEQLPRVQPDGRRLGARRRPGRHPGQEPTLAREPRREAPPGLRRHLDHHRRVRVAARRRAQHHPEEVRRGRVPLGLGEGPQAEHGDDATTAHLARTDAQRRFDALFAIFQKAADAHAAAPGGSRIVTDVVIDQDTFERLAAILAGGTVEEPDPLFSAFPATKYRCSTLDGHPVEATEAVAHALIGHIRRVVIGSDSVVIDLGRDRRLFTGAAALAVKLSQTTCSWPGCLVPVTQCQCDHVEPWTRRPDGRGGGCTCPGNGASCCGRHNREKERGYTVHRDRHRHLAHPPPRRHRDRMTRREGSSCPPGCRSTARWLPRPCPGPRPTTVVGRAASTPRRRRRIRLGHLWSGRLDLRACGGRRRPTVRRHGRAPLPQPRPAG